MSGTVGASEKMTSDQVSDSPPGAQWMSQFSNGLARAVAAEQPGDRPGLDVEGDVVQGELAAVAAGEPGHRDRWRHSLYLPARVHPSGASLPATPAGGCLEKLISV